MNFLMVFDEKMSNVPKVAFSQKRLEDVFVAKINIPNHYPEQKI